jgi:hypothetical protein
VRSLARRVLDLSPRQPNMTLDEIVAVKCKQVITGSHPEEPA